MVFHCFKDIQQYEYVSQEYEIKSIHVGVLTT